MCRPRPTYEDQREDYDNEREKDIPRNKYGDPAEECDLYSMKCVANKRVWEDRRPKYFRTSESKNDNNGSDSHSDHDHD